MTFLTLPTHTRAMDVVFSVHEQHKRQGQILLYTVYQVVYVYASICNGSKNNPGV